MTFNTLLLQSFPLSQYQKLLQKQMLILVAKLSLRWLFDNIGKEIVPISHGNITIRYSWVLTVKMEPNDITYSFKGRLIAKGILKIYNSDCSNTFFSGGQNCILFASWSSWDSSFIGLKISRTSSFIQWTFRRCLLEQLLGFVGQKGVLV